MATFECGPPIFGVLSSVCSGATLESATKVNSKNFEMVLFWDGVNDDNGYIQNKDGKGYIYPSLMSGEEQVVTLDNSTLSAMYLKTQRKIYTMESLIFKNDNTQKFGTSPGTPLQYWPCVINNFNLHREKSTKYLSLIGVSSTSMVISRIKIQSYWMHETDDSKCDNLPVTIANSTSELFAKLLSKNTDMNTILQDITVHTYVPHHDAVDVDKDGMHERDEKNIFWGGNHPGLHSVYGMTNFLCEQNKVVNGY
eukprot:9621044-Ditylum_brightwellii.AAC.1